jgi:hypothetical protein
VTPDVLRRLREYLQRKRIPMRRSVVSAGVSKNQCLLCPHGFVMARACIHSAFLPFEVQLVCTFRLTAPLTRALRQACRKDEAQSRKQGGKQSLEPSSAQLIGLSYSISRSTLLLGSA